MSRANLVVLTRGETAPGISEAFEKLPELPVFSAATRLLGLRRHAGGMQLQPAQEAGAGPFFAFCGIGNPQAFLRDLRRWGVPICGRIIFADHHLYSQRDVLTIHEQGKKAGAKAFVTTEKDAQNLSGLKFDAPLFISVIDLEVSPEPDFRNILDRLLAAKIGAAA